MASTRPAGESARPAILLFMALAFLSLASAKTTTFEGTYVRTSGHGQIGYSVQLSNGTTVILPSAPKSVYGNQTVPNLAKVRATCTLVNWRIKGRLVDCSKDLQPVTVLATQDVAANSYKVTALTGETTSNIKFKVTMVLADMSECGLEQTVTEDDVNNVLAKTNDLISKCSYGSMSIDLENSQVISLSFPCTDDNVAAVKTCSDPNSETLKALTYQALADNGNDVETQIGVSHVGVVVPPGAVNCDWAALAQVGIAFTWYQPIDYGILRPGTVTQELLHNFGLLHSSKDGDACTCDNQPNLATCRCHDEYGDFSTPMGRGDACLTAPEMFRLNWATAIASLDAGSLDVGAAVSYTLPATYTTSTNMVIVKPTWSAPYTNNLYFSLRIKSGADALLDGRYTGVVSVHRTDQRVDATNSNDNLLAHIITTIKPSSSVQLTQFKIVATTGELADDSVPLTLCRYSAAASECGSTGLNNRAPPAPTASPTCADKGSKQDCSYWTDEGYCDSDSEYYQYVAANCAKSCGLCTTTTTAITCQDKSASCASDVAGFGCDGDAPINTFLRTQCPKTCKQCGSSGVSAFTGTGQRCVDLSSSCDVFKKLATCNPAKADAKRWMQINCQATCELCPVTRSAASIGDQLPLGCTAGYDVSGVATLSTKKGLNESACWDLCYNTDGCYFFSHYSSDNTCVLRTTLEDAVKSKGFKVVTNASRTLCVLGTDQTNLTAVPELLTWFYCVDGLDVSGSLVAVQSVRSELECARACNESATCRQYTLLQDNSCILKSDSFSSGLGTTAFDRNVKKTCVQTFYRSPPSSSSKRRRALADATKVVPARLSRSMLRA